MITEAIAVADLLGSAAVAVAGTLASSQPLAPAEPIVGTDVELELDGTHAVLVPFSGPIAGEFALIIEGELTTALQDTPLGTLDLSAALGPTIEAVGKSFGDVVLGPVQQIESNAALSRLLGTGDFGLVPLVVGDAVAAIVVISVQGAGGAPIVVETAAVAEAAAAAAPGTAAAAVAAAAVAAMGPGVVPVQPSTLAGGFIPTADRLDVLRGVEMAATAELGRVRMTVNDLLALRDGAVIELDRAAGAPADLYVNGRLIAKGEVVVVDENYGLRITQVVTDADTR
ncbi:MAG TPA: flagellar motor switch protein FliN [Jatrophihabitans sp.]